MNTIYQYFVSSAALAFFVSSGFAQQLKQPIGAEALSKGTTALSERDRTPVAVHGPFVRDIAEVARSRNAVAPDVTFLTEDEKEVLTEDEKDVGRDIGPAGPRLRLMRRIGGGASDGNGDGESNGSKPGPRGLGAPLPNPEVVNGSAGVIDPQIAVGDNDVLVTLRDTMLFFKKSKLIGQPSGAKVDPAKVMSTEDFFASLTPDINQHLQQPVGYGVKEGFGIDPLAFHNNTYYDARAIYDNYRKRFWVIALAITQKASLGAGGEDGKKTCADPIRQSARRTKIAVAVSQGDDPSGKWNFYWWDGNKDEETDQRIVSTKYFSHVDYPLLGISKKYLLVTNRADICQTAPGAWDPTKEQCGLPKPNCTPPDPVNLKTENYAYITVAPADALAAGATPEGKTEAFGYKNLKYPDGTIVGPGNMPTPAMHDGAVPFGLSFFANPYVDTAKKSTLNVWYLDPATPDAPTFSRLSVPIRPLAKIDGTSGATSAAFRGQELTVAFAESVGCVSPASIFAIRVIRLNVITNKVLIDSTTGTRSPEDPAKVNCVHYFQPAIQVNKNGDAAFVYTRVAAPVPLEARYSVIHHGSLTQPPSVLLHAGAPVDRGFDTPGISLDPDDQAIWFANPYLSGTGPQIVIGRIWGQ